MTQDASGKIIRRRRGLFDFLLLLGLGYGVYAATPIGAVTETAIRVARGQKDHPSWFATFRGRDTAAASSTGMVATAALGQLARGSLPLALQKAAADHDVDADALAALVAVRGACDGAACGADAPDKLSMFVPGASGRVDVDVLASGLQAAKLAVATATQTTSAAIGDELALEALFVGTPALVLAVEQARRSALDGVDDVEVHSAFFSPGQRRGPLQGALAVLLVHRLRTLAWPADGFRISSPFGERVHPVTGLVRLHNGTDIATPTGTPLKAAHNGIVKRASVDSISGNYVVLDHGLGVQTTYCHLSEIDSVEKRRIARTDIIGRSGSTGRVTGPHLHYILRVNATAVDAEQYGRAPGNSNTLTPPPSTSIPPPPPPPPVVPTKKKSKPPPTAPAAPEESAPAAPVESAPAASPPAEVAPAVEPATSTG